MIRVSNLTKTFSSGLWPFKSLQHYTAVENISFSLVQGEILGFLGPNGAGKTTTIQMLTGTLTPTSGSIEYFGQDFAKNRTEILKKIGYASGYDKLPGRLSVAENLDVVARVYGIERAQRAKRIDHLVAAFGLEDKRDRQVCTLSAGQSTRVMLAKAFIADPKIVLLDEPTASLDPDVAQEVRQFIIEQRKEQGVSLLVTSHNMDEVSEICDRVLVLKQGKIIADNTPEQLAQSIAKVRVHLTLSSPIAAATVFIESLKKTYSAEDMRITIDLDEHEIAQFLASLGDKKIFYSQISIDKPTLEDYFLSIAK